MQIVDTPGHGVIQAAQERHIYALGAVPGNADKVKVFEVVSNPLKNAMKFTPKNGTITVSTEKQDDSVVIKVKDNGRSIDPEVIHKLFQKFAYSSEIGGTGLGMFISKSIVEAHRGRSWAENNADGKVGNICVYAAYCQILNEMRFGELLYAG